MDDLEFFEPEFEDERPPDPQQKLARDELERFFDEHREEVFFSRQLEVQVEHKYFHWITNRALRQLAEEGVLRREQRDLATGSSITLLWHRGYRYYKRAAKGLVALVEAYADPNIGGALGLQGEALVLEGFARSQFIMRGRDARGFAGRSWTRTNHDLDFIFERDGVAYGVEVKNTLGYMPHDELVVKVEMCEALDLRPVFVVRMLPKSWIHEVVEAGGFVLVLKYQLYPWTHRELASRVAEELGLPVDAPRALAEGTILRFLRWHDRNV